jgi:hypothetical protein
MINSNATNSTSQETLEVEFLGIEMSATGTKGCASCDSTRTRLDAAIASVRPVLGELGIDVKVTERYVATEEEVRTLRLQGSPTIRVRGYEISPEHRGTSEDSRVWTWQGEEHRLAPKAMILDTILRGYAATSRKQEASGNANAIPAYMQQFLKPEATGVATECNAQQCAGD